MKKLLLVIGTIGLMAATQINAALISTNILASASSQTFLLTTNRAYVYSVTLSGAYNTLLSLYDCDSVAAPYYGTNYTTTSNLVSVTQYTTNIASSYVGSNGYTNWTTNSGVFTLYSTNSALTTNALSPLLSFPVAANTFEVFNADALFVRGITAIVPTNVSVVITYRTAQ